MNPAPTDPDAVAGDHEAASGRLRILVVDDDEVDRLAVRRHLRQAGIEATIDEADNAAEALARLLPGSHDCVLLDYYLPGIDTGDLIQQIRAGANDVPVVIFTGRGDEMIAVDSMKAGAVDYIPKALLSPERLAASLRHVQEMSRAAAARRQALAEQRQVEQALREREAEFRTLANSISQLAWITDGEGRRYWYNDRWYEYSGMRPDESLGLGWLLIHHPDERAQVLESQLDDFRAGRVWERTVTLRGGDGSYRWFLARAMPIRGPDGGILRWIGTDTDVTEERQASLERERLLELEHRARDEAERATRARDEMLAIVAHDLRNPIQTIVAAASALAGDGDDEAQRRPLATILRATDEMERLIADLLDVSRIEAGTFAVRPQPVDVRALVAETIEQFQPQAAARGITLGAELDARVQTIQADRDRLFQVLSNLLANALKFTPAGRPVAIHASPLPGAVQISVADAGHGIPPESLPHLFDRFWQADRASRAGAGLGLAICKGIVEAHRGRIWAVSSTGEGTTMHFTLPATEAR